MKKLIILLIPLLLTGCLPDIFGPTSLCGNPMAINYDGAEEWDENNCIFCTDGLQTEEQYYEYCCFDPNALNTNSYGYWDGASSTQDTTWCIYP